MAKGFDVVGDLKPTGHFVPLQRIHAKSLESLWRSSRDIRRSILQGLVPSGDGVLDVEVTTTTQDECDRA